MFCESNDASLRSDRQFTLLCFIAIYLFFRFELDALVNFVRIFLAQKQVERQQHVNRTAYV